MNNKILRILILIAAALSLHVSAFASDQICEKKLTFADAQTHAVMGKRNVQLAAYSFENPESTRAVVLVTGLGDAAELLEETIQDFYHAGFSVFIMDHRGQGRSTLIHNQKNSHIDQYEFYVNDLDRFIETVVKPSRFEKTFLVGNSMGGAISFLYLRTHPKNQISKAVFLSPMFGLPIPTAVSNAIAHVGAAIQGRAGSFLTKYRPKFEKNTLTTDAERFAKYEGFFTTHPEVPGYAPSHNWMLEANLMIQDVQDTHPREVQTPIQVYCAGLDKLVSNKATEALASKLDNMNVTHLPNSKHGPHFECDAIRRPLLDEIIKSFKE